VNHDVVVVGSVNRDYVCRVDALPAPGETVLGGEFTVGSGGKGGNQAVAASRMGARTALVAGVGDDHDGRALLADLAAAGVDCASVTLQAGVRTGVAFVWVDAAGDNSIVVAPGANHRLDAGAVRAALGDLLHPEAVLVTQAEIPADALAAAVETAASAGCRSVVNLAPFRPLPTELLARCDPLVVNESEASGLLGRTVRGPDDARRAAGELARRAASVVLTIGADGALVGAADEVHHLPAAPVPVVDTTGAGDAFTGALAAALSSGSGLLEAARIGVRAGSHAVSGTGAQASYPDRAALGLPPIA